MAAKIEIAEPSALYKPFIRYYKYIESDIIGIMKVIPNTTTELYFNYTRIGLYSDPNYSIENPMIHVTGYHGYNQTILAHMTGAERNGGFAIVFQPQGFYDLFDIKGSDFCNYVLIGESVLKKDIYHLWEKLRPCWNVGDMKKIAENYLTRYVKKSNVGSQLINIIVHCMDSNEGIIRVSQLCNKFNITSRSLERRFREEIGLSPKEILQVSRINTAVRMIMENPETDLTKIAYMSGFYDQSHFIREIKRITGILPGELKGTKSAKGIPIHNLLFINEK